MRRAFTMIELIFIIVIIGILAAVAIPKMAGTRDDAKISVMAGNIKVLTNEIASYVLATKNVDANFTEMSETIRIMLNSGDAILQSESLINVKMNTANECIKISLEETGNNRQVVVSNGGTNDDDLCISLQSLINLDNYIILISGVTAKR